MWTVVNCCESLQNHLSHYNNYEYKLFSRTAHIYEYILKDRSRKSGFYGPCGNCMFPRISICNTCILHFLFSFVEMQFQTIKDKSVDTFEQNKHFLLASLRNFKKNLFCWLLNPPSTLFNVQWNTLCGHRHLVTTLKRGEGGRKCEYWRLQNSLVQRNRSLLESVSTAFVHDCR